jgi:hypothetical protein
VPRGQCAQTDGAGTRLDSGAAARRASSVLLIAAVLAIGAAGCARVGPSSLAALREQHVLVTEVGTLVLAFTPEDGASRETVERAVRAAAPRLTRWGRLRVPVRVMILPDHDALEHATGRFGYGWLRAWARYDEVLIQSPRTWGLVGAKQSDVDELILHELTHCLMYQRASDPEGWSRKGIPLWFREGMASVTAGQGYQWSALEDLARFYDEQQIEDPLGTPEALYRDRRSIVYGAAHHAFLFLIKRYGEDSVRRMLDLMSSGTGFREAFQESTLLAAEDFVQDFRRYLRLRGYRGGRSRP